MIGVVGEGHVSTQEANTLEYLAAAFTVRQFISKFETGQILSMHLTKVDRVTGREIRSPMQIRATRNPTWLW